MPEIDSQQQASANNDSGIFQKLRTLVAAVLLGNGASVTEAAIQADRGVFQAQNAYEVGNGECSEQDVVESWIDRMAAHMAIFLQENGAELIERGCEIAGTWLETQFQVLFGPGAIMVGRKIGRFVGESLSKTGVVLVDKGMRKIAAYAKKIWQKSKTKLHGVVEKATDLFA